MSNIESGFAWRVFAESVQGASRVRSGTPNQDAVDWQAVYGADQPLVVLALADGHGSPHYVRSAEGAKLAVQAAKSVLWELAEEHKRTANLAATRQLIEQHLPKLITRRWNQLVDAHLAAAPLTAPAQQANPRIIYGSTLVALLVTGDFLLYIQLGDGDIVAVDAQGQSTRPPLPVDTRLLGDVTTSLCMPDAWRYVRSYFHLLADKPPALVMLATDGYANSFASEADFLLAAQDIFNLVREQGKVGVAALRTHLAGWLRATSDGGSGDDISVGILYREVA
jgi:serine/threonine protein phosphatase PrpC